MQGTDRIARAAVDTAVELPQGTVTFLFTDIEGSTRLLSQLGDGYSAVLLDHREILRSAFERWRGVEVDTQGDSFFAAFASPADAVACGFDIQRALAAHAWPDGVEVRVRMAIHSGQARREGRGYVGIEVHRAARIMAAAHGGQVLVSEAVAALAGDELPEGASLADLGEFQLKDLDRADRLFQLAHDDLVPAFPPLRTIDHRPNNVPIPVSAFVGREVELAEISRQLSLESNRLITLIGAGGSGKTRLAIRAATDELARLNDRVFFVDLAAATDTESVLAAIARVLGVSRTREQPVLEDLKHGLRDRPSLLVLDNFEQVLAAAGAIAELLEVCPNLGLLVTSREALHIRGEHVFPVPPLSLPAAAAARESAKGISGFEAIQLFVERARAVQPGFRLTDDNAASVAEICRRLDGLPLAIELATARINLFSPETLRDRLTSRLGTLDRGARDLPARQRTLRATIDWSYQLLGAGEKRLFELLSVFAEIRIDALEEVAKNVGLLDESTVDPLEGLASLLDKSLVRPSDGGPEPGGFVMLETIREFAAEQLANRTDLAAPVRLAHATYFTSYAQLKLADATGQEGAPALAALAGEIENLRAAWRYWVSTNDLEQLNGLIESLWLVYNAEGRYRSTAEVTSELLDILAASPSSDERWLREVTLRSSYARTLMAIRGYTAEVEDAYAAALELFEDQRDRPQVYPVLRDLARFYIGGSEMGKAAAVAQEILGLADRQDDQGMRLDGHLILGTVLAFAGDLPGAAEQLDQGIEAFESPTYRPRQIRLGTDPRISCLAASGFVLWALGFPDRAVDRSDRGVALAAQLDPYSLAYGLFHSAFLHVWRSEPMRVAERARQLLDLVADHDFPIWRAVGTCLAGAASTFLGQPAEGLAQIDQGMADYQGMRSPPVFWPYLRFVQSASLAGAGRVADALTILDEMLATMADLAAATQFHVLRGDLRLALGDGGSAEESYRQSIEMARRIGATAVELQAETHLLRLRRGRGDDDNGDALRAVYDRFTEGFATRDLAEASELLA